MHPCNRLGTPLPFASRNRERLRPSNDTGRLASAHPLGSSACAMLVTIYSGPQPEPRLPVLSIAPLISTFGTQAQSMYAKLVYLFPVACALISLATRADTRVFEFDEARLIKNTALVYKKSNIDGTNASQ